MTDRISSDEVNDALTRSGYLLENRLEKILRKNGFYVEANSAYLDAESAKSRELDLFAMNGYRVSSYDYELIYSVLLVEAINNPQPIAFITKESQISFLHHEDIKLAGLPVKIFDNNVDEKWIFLPEYIGMSKYHHYCEGRVATQYCSFVQKKNELGKKEWMAFHDEAHFNSFRTLSVAVEYFQDLLYKSWKKGSSAVNLEFYYPIVVVQGELLEVRPEQEELNVESTSHIQYRRTSVIGSKEIAYQIDVVTEEYFSAFLGTIRSEMEHTGQQLSSDEAKIRASIKKIVAQANQAKSYDEVKAAFSYHYPLAK